MMKQVRIVSDGTVRGTYVYDAETGDKIEYVSRIEIVLDAQRQESVAVLHIDRPIFEFTGDADLVSPSGMVTIDR